MKRIKWILVNGAMGYLIYCALVLENGWAINLSQFAIWIFFVGSLLLVVSLTSEDAVKKLREKEISRSVPHWLDALYDLIIIAFLVAYGWTFYGFLWLIQMICVAVAYAKAEEVENV